MSATADQYPHHCSPSDYLAMIARLKQIEAGEVRVGDVDWRTTAGVLAIMLEHATTRPVTR